MKNIFKIIIWLFFFFFLFKNSFAYVIENGCNTPWCSIDFTFEAPNGKTFKSFDYELFYRWDLNSHNETASFSVQWIEIFNWNTWYQNNVYRLVNSWSLQNSIDWFSVINFNLSSTNAVNISPSGMTNFIDVKISITNIVYNDDLSWSWSLNINFWGLSTNSQSVWEWDKLIIKVENWNLYINYSNLFMILIDFLLIIFFLFLFWKSLVFSWKLLFW